MTSLESGSVPNALLITQHGFDSRIWGGFADLLRESAHVVAVDWPRLEGGVLEMTSAIDDLVRDSGIAEFDLVVAVGLDAAAAIHLATRGVVRSVALIDPSPGQGMPEVPFPDLETEIDGVLSAASQDLVAAVAGRDRAAWAAIATEMSTEGLSPADRRLVHDVIFDNADTVFDGVLTRAEGTWWPDGLSRLRQPVLAFARAHADGSFTRHRPMVEALAARCPHGTYVAVDSRSDFCWLDKPDEMVAALLRLTPSREDRLT